jgi:hypothetical protein
LFTLVSGGRYGVMRMREIKLNSIALFAPKMFPAMATSID